MSRDKRVAELVRTAGDEPTLPSFHGKEGLTGMEPMIPWLKPVSEVNEERRQQQRKKDLEDYGKLNPDISKWSPDDWDLQDRAEDILDEEDPQEDEEQ